MLRKAARALTKGYDKALEGTGLRITQYALLNHIYRMEPVSFQSLSSAISLERTTLIRNLNLLCKQGFVHTESESRTHMLTLTDEGRMALEAARPHWRTAQDRILESLSNEEKIFLDGMLNRLQHIFEDNRAGAE